MLIVEDELLVAWHLESLVREQNLEVCGLVPDGEGAIEQAIDLDVDLILMDIRLAGRMDGIEAARRIREQRDTPIIFITAHGDRATRAQIEQVLPGAPVLAKPITADRLQAQAICATVSKTELARHVTAVGASASMSVTTSMMTGRLAASACASAAGKRLRILDADAERAHLLGDAGEVGLAEGPQFARLLGLGAAIDAVEAALATGCRRRCC